MTRSNRIALTTLFFCTAAQVASAQSAGLVAGGNTIAGPGTTKLAAQAQQDVYTDASGNSDACVTLVNGGKGAVRVALTGSGSSNIDVAGGATAAVCLDSLELVELTCLAVAPGTCSAQWRVDRD